MSANAHSTSTSTKNGWETKQLVTVALMCAIAVLLSFIEFPIFPSAGFLKLDIALVPSTIVGFAYGPMAGIICGVAAAAVHAALDGNWVGAIMNSIVALAFILPATAIRGKDPSIKRTALAMVVAAVSLIVCVSAANLVIDPAFYGIPFDVVMGLIPVAIIPFNMIKAVVVSVITVLAYRSIASLIAPKA